MERLSLASWLGMARLPPEELSKQFEQDFLQSHILMTHFYFGHRGNISLGGETTITDSKIMTDPKHKPSWVCLVQKQRLPKQQLCLAQIPTLQVHKLLSLLHELVGRHSCYLPCVVSICSNRGLSLVILNSQVLNSVQYRQQLDLMGTVYASPVLDSRRHYGGYLNPRQWPSNTTS